MNTQKTKLWNSVYHRDHHKVHFSSWPMHSTIQDVIKEDLILYGFADDHSLRRPFNPNQANSGKIAIIENSM